MLPVTNTFRWTLLLVWLVSEALLYVLLRQSGYPQECLITDVVTTATVSTLAIWVSVLSIYKYPTKAGLTAYGVLIGLAMGYGAWVLDKLLLLWGADNPAQAVFLEKAKWLKLVFFCGSNMWAATYTAISRKARVLEEQFKERTDAVALHREAELFKLRQQLQPHFLYNSLNSISALIMVEPDRAQEMIGRLSDFLRSSVKREGMESIPITEELQYIEAYLAIEAVRFGDRLQVVYNRQYTDHAVIPPFLLQPLLENAIKFGLYGKTGQVTIAMHIQLAAPMLRIDISNPYEESQQPPSGTGFGLEGIRRRLFLLFGRTDLLETNRRDGYFMTTLFIPQDNAESHTNR